LAYRTEKYRLDLKAAVEKNRKTYEEFRRKPEDHPNYKPEWEQFWRKRFAELVSEGKDARSHNYEPEWFNVWAKKRKTLQKIELSMTKEKLRHKHALSVEETAKVDNDLKKLKDVERPTMPKRPIEISDDSDADSKQSWSSESKKRRVQATSASKFGESSRNLPSTSRSFGESSTTSTAGTSQSFSLRPSSSSYSASVCLVSVCRFLSALEAELGLLAPPVLDLLSKAIAMEKSKPNSSEKLLEDSETFNLLATTKEKFKGILSANLIAKNKFEPIKKAIVDISRLLSDFKADKSLEPPKVAEASGGDVDQIAALRLQISQIITAKLLQEGRTGISPEDLEGLVESFIGSGEDNDQQEPDRVRQATAASLQSDSSDLTDQELEVLLGNFQDLTEAEQQHLISYLNEIEKSDPERTERLKKFVKF
jgi:hypothetical protein